MALTDDMKQKLSVGFPQVSLIRWPGGIAVCAPPHLQPGARRA